jgi:hypothetical protein
MYEDEGIARALAKKGRYGDTMLMHVNPMEVQSMADNGMITINPDTGQPEAFLQFLPALFSAIATPALAAGGALASGIGTVLSAVPFVGPTLGKIPAAIGGGLTGASATTAGTAATGIGSVPTALGGGGLGNLGTSISSLGGQLPKITGALSGPQGIGQMGADLIGKIFPSPGAGSSVGSVPGGLGKQLPVLPEGVGTVSIPKVSEAYVGSGAGASGVPFQLPVLPEGAGSLSIPELSHGMSSSYVGSGSGSGVANILEGSEIAKLGSLPPVSPAGTGGLGSLKEMGSGALKFAKDNPFATLIGINAIDSWTRDDGGGPDPSVDDRSEEEKEYWSHYSSLA